MPDSFAGTVIGAGTLALMSGLPGPPNEAPGDAVYGRQGDTWLPALPLTGGVIYGGGGTIALAAGDPISDQGGGIPLEIRADQGQRAGIIFHQIYARVWSAGTPGDGRFIIVDESADLWRLVLNNDGSFNVNGGALDITGTLSGATVYGRGDIHSYGNIQASTNVTAGGNISAGGRVISGNWASIHGHGYGFMWGDGWFGTNGSFRAWDIQATDFITTDGYVGVIGAFWLQNSGAGALYTNEFRATSELHCNMAIIDRHMNIGNDLHVSGIFYVGGWATNPPGGSVPLSNQGGWLRIEGGYGLTCVGTMSTDTWGTGMAWIPTITGIGVAPGLRAGGWGIQTSISGGWVAAFHHNGWPHININTIGWYRMDAGSDARLKTDIAPSTLDCLAAVRQMPLYQFRLQPPEVPPSEPSPLMAQNSFPPIHLPRNRRAGSVIPVGLVAQELYKVFPAGVDKGDDGEGDSDPKNRFVWSLDEAVMTAVLAGAVQQLAERMDDLDGGGS